MFQAFSASPIMCTLTSAHYHSRRAELNPSPHHPRRDSNGKEGRRMAETRFSVNGIIMFASFLPTFRVCARTEEEKEADGNFGTGFSAVVGGKFT
jgi:hypothetical protein